MSLPITAIEQGAQVRLTKLKGPVGPRPDSINLGYTIEGVLLFDLKIGAAIKVWRHVRNGEVIEGMFISSAIQMINGNEIHTTNSIWKIEVLP